MTNSSKGYTDSKSVDDLVATSSNMSDANRYIEMAEADIGDEIDDFAKQFQNVLRKEYDECVRNTSTPKECFSKLLMIANEKAEEQTLILVRRYLLDVMDSMKNIRDPFPSSLVHESLTRYTSKRSRTAFQDVLIDVMDKYHKHEPK